MSDIDKLKEIAKEKGGTYLLGSVCTDNNNCTESLKWVLSIGYKLSHNTGNMIYFTMDLGE